MREEAVTKNILIWLEKNKWKIVSYDFPQSGTGILIQSNNEKSKNKGGIIPDIIAVKENLAIYFENKDRFYAPDFDKLEEIKNSDNYSSGLAKVLEPYKVNEIYFGISFPTNNKDEQKALQKLGSLDFLISVDKDNSIKIIFDRENIFSN